MDPFGTVTLREQVLAAWAASPDRFREDANAEEDLALGGYRDRLVVELAQNAADAAARAGVPGRLLLRLAEADGSDLLVAANTGAPLDAAGVRGLASLRASAKRDDDPAATVGRFGVGFAAVLAVTDEPGVVSHGRGVRFSRGDTLALVREAAGASPGLADELDRRDQHVPVLRLPFPAQGAAPEGYDTAVLVPLRDGAALDLVRHLLDDVDDALLLALPGLAEVVVERPGHPPVRLAGAADRWHAHRRQGTHPPEVLAGRPTEERQRPGWSLTWALPRSPATTAVPPVLHAPTPTDEPMAWPALLVASFPLDPTRRHVAAGPATDALVEQAAGAYADLLAERAQAGDDVLPLVPTGLPAGALDADLREAVLARLPGVPLLRSVEDGALLRPRDAVALDGAAGSDPTALAVLAPVLAGLVASPRSATAALRALGVRRLGLAEVVDELPAEPSPTLWGHRYAGLAGLADDAADREALAALPVPLADGRLVRGVRGLVLASPGVPAGALSVAAAHGLRVVHPDALTEPAAVRLLERLGARAAGPRELLEDPSVRSAVTEAAEAAEGAGDPLLEESVTAVLGLVAAAVAAGDLAPGDLPWLADLPLPDTDGEPAPAGALVLPGSPAEQLLDPDEVDAVDPAVLDRWGRDVLEAVGVAGTLALVRATEVDTEDLPEELADLEGAQDWADAVGPGTAAELVALRDLDLVRDDAWPRALALVAADPQLREAVTAPVLLRAGATSRRAPAYSAWWLRQRLGLAGQVDPGSDADPALGALLPPAPEWVGALDPGLRSALGLVRAWADLDSTGWDAVLAALADPAADPPLSALLAAWRALAESAAGEVPVDVDPPDRVRALGPGGRPVLVDADEAVVVDAPMWAQRGDLGGLVLAPAGTADALADQLDLAVASERAAGRVQDAGQPAEVPAQVRAVLPKAPATWREHERLLVDGVEVGWWVDADGEVHAVTLAGLARGLAQAAGAWGRRLLVEAVLTDPGALGDLLAEESVGE